MSGITPEMQYSEEEVLDFVIIVSVITPEMQYSKEGALDFVFIVSGLSMLFGNCMFPLIDEIGFVYKWMDGYVFI